MTNHVRISMNVPEKLYTNRDLQKARTKGKVVGWIQGAAIGAGGFFLMGFAGWIPVLLVAGGLGYLGFKLWSRGRRKNAEAGD